MTMQSRDEAGKKCTPRVLGQESGQGWGAAAEDKINTNPLNNYSLLPFVNDALCMPFKYCNLCQSCSTYSRNEGEEINMIVVEVSHVGLTAQDGSKTRFK